MFHPITTHRSHDGTLGRRFIVLALAALLLLLALGAYAVFADQGRPARPSTPTPAAEGNMSAIASAETFGPTLLEPTSDPATFARRVTMALFVWDTADAATPDKLIQTLVSVGDPTGESITGLLADVTSHLPTNQIWVQLAQFETRQWIEIASVRTPRRWATAVQQAGPNGLLPGTTAFTIRGTRHRSGVWEGTSVASAHQVSFTVFIVCAPTYARCHLLRLSRVDDPLQ